MVAIEAAFELLYGEGDDGQPPARARHRALPATAPEVDLADGRQADYGVRYSGDYADEYSTGPADYPAAPAADYRAEYPDGPSGGPYAAGQYGGQYDGGQYDGQHGGGQYDGQRGGDRYGGDQADYPAEYRTDPPATDAHPDPDVEAPRRRADRAVGSTYSSYTWDTSP